MTAPLIKAIARAICKSQGDPENCANFYDDDAQAALTAITEAGYEISPKWLPQDRLEAAHDMLRWARAALDDGYRTTRRKHEIDKIDQYFAAISAAQGDG